MSSRDPEGLVDEADFHRGVYDWEDEPVDRPEAHSRGLDLGLLLLRLGALLLLPHGLHKAFDLVAFREVVAGNVVGATAPELVAWLVILGQVGLPLLIAVGLFTRPAGFLAAAMMSAIWALVVLAGKDYTPMTGSGAVTGESDLLVVALTLPLAFTGAGRWSLDAMRTGGRP